MISTASWKAANSSIAISIPSGIRVILQSADIRYDFLYIVRAFLQQVLTIQNNIANHIDIISRMIHQIHLSRLFYSKTFITISFAELDGKEEKTK